MKTNCEPMFLFHPSAFILAFRLCSSNGTEQASHKREVGGSTPPTATKVRAGDVTESIEVLQTSREGLNPSQSTNLAA